MDKLKLFVWEGQGVLQDYTPGMVCVLAENLEQAIKLIGEKYESYYFSSIPFEKYKVYDQPEAFACYGGG